MFNQTHFNIVNARTDAITFLNKHKGCKIFVNGEVAGKMVTINRIKSGLLDGYYYSVDFILSNNTDPLSDPIRVIKLTYHNANNYTRKIGN